MNRTKIEWTDYSWNPIVGCKHECWYCYARKLAIRFPKVFPNGFEPTFYPERLKEPYELKKPSKIFVCSIADLFAPWTEPEWRHAVLQSIMDCPIPHTFQLLTKNPECIPQYLLWKPNIWLGATVTTENGDCENIEIMKRIHGVKVKFISFEPLLGGNITSAYDLDGIQWVIIGKLTGSKKIKLDSQWVWEIVNNCHDLEIPIFMKNNLSPPLEKFELVQEFPKTY